MPLRIEAMAMGSQIPNINVFQHRHVCQHLSQQSNHQGIQAEVGAQVGDPHPWVIGFFIFLSQT